MTAHDPNFARLTGGLLQWLGLSRLSDPALARPASTTPLGDRRAALRAQLLKDVGRFLLRHQLEVNAFTLGVACDYITRADHDLVRRIDEHQHDGKPLTTDWLDMASHAAKHHELAELQEVMERLEGSLDQFGQTSHEARSATRDYGSALAAHVGELEQVSQAGVVISELATIAKVMLVRTREIEREMSRSEAQTRQLRKRLDEARRTSEQDHLTGLPNRRAFELRFETEYEEARAAGEVLCVAFCDIDHFKAVNDTHGHDAGDRVLKVVANSLSRISNERCHVARHGGEEFVALFRGLSLPDAVARLDLAREEMAQRKLVNRANALPFGTITFSAGIAEVGAYSSRSDALKAADAALYRAKQAGRNRIAVADPAAS